MVNQNSAQKNESISDTLKKYKESRNINEVGVEPQQQNTVQATIPYPQEHNNIMNRETDPDLMTSFEIVKFPSNGLLYSHGISEVMVEYMTSRDEDLLTTPSLIENGTALDILLKEKLKQKVLTQTNYWLVTETQLFYF